MDFKLRGLKKKSNVSILLGSCRYTDFSVYLGVTEEMKYFSNDSCWFSTFMLEILKDFCTPYTFKSCLLICSIISDTF